MGITRAPSSLHASILELSLAAEGIEEFRREALALLDRQLGFRCALFLSLPGEGGPGARVQHLTLAGLDPSYAETFTRRFGVFARELGPVKARAAGALGIAVDTDVLGASARHCRYYRELVQPAGGGHSLLGFLELRGAPLGVLMLGRELALPFRDGELASMRELSGILALGLAGFAAGAGAPAERGRDRGPALPRLTTREQGIADLLCRGLTNREIAALLGTSPNTVRNQLAVLFAKLGATTRAEAVGLLLRP